MSARSDGAGAGLETAAQRAPIRLRAMGSFHVGGKQITLSGKPLSQHQMAVGGAPVTLDPNGVYIVGQMYAQYFLTEPHSLSESHDVPLLFWHGGGLTGACWERTPDGREGWLGHFLRVGWDSYLCDAAERGRSGFAPVPDVWEAPLSQSADDVFKRFRIGPGPGPGSLDIEASRAAAYPNTKFPLEAFEAMVAQLVPRWTHTDEIIFDAYLALLDRVGESAIVCHSQGGVFGIRAAMRRPEKVRAVVALEPAAVPDAVASEAFGYDVPTLILMGDNMDTDARWPTTRANIMAFAARHACVEVVSLPALGITGNSHMLMMDTNSEQLADIAQRWLNDTCSGTTERQASS
ncbi:esterase [soil metagenome]